MASPYHTVMRPYARRIAAFAMCLGLGRLGAQATQEVPVERRSVLQVFLDCQRMHCDNQFVRTEISWVNFVRDRLLADVHVLITSQGTGGAAMEVMLEFRGQGSRALMRDTAVFNTRLGDNDDDIRRQLTRNLSLGLVRYVRGLPTASQLQIVSRPEARASEATASRGVRDRWNYWVYRISANANLDANSNFSSQNYNSRLFAGRVTDAWKLQFSGRANYSERTVQLNAGEITVIQRALGGSADIIRSLNAHWSTGLQLGAQQDLFRNYDLDLQVKPGIEYNVFPYSEATRRQVLLRYSVGVRAFDYVDTTIYQRIRETRPSHAFVVSVDAIQPWGTMGASLNASQYLHDLKRRQFGIFGNARWRIIRGLDYNVGGGYSYIRDQLNIRGAGLSDEQRIIQLREQATNYSYHMFTGLSYTFGSAFNNVVNTRFGGGDRFF